jgi:NTE family protein
MTCLNNSDGVERKTARARGRSVINLALQGGGSHGAFAWGVLDRLLEQESLYFEGISGTSAGAANAVVLADGLATGGREGQDRHCELIGKESPSSGLVGPSNPRLAPEGIPISDSKIHPAFGSLSR